ncbi:MAG: TIM barrel protein [Eubacteriales bacterium]|nr:TIM barrel protein [Eubacteriales bacterium]
MDVGMPTLLETPTLAEAARQCAALGLAFVEVNFSFPQWRPERLTAGQLRALQAQTGVYFTFHLDENTDPANFDPGVAQAYTRTAVRAVTLAREVGVPLVNLHLPRGSYITLPAQKVFLYERHEAHYRQAMEDFGRQCLAAAGGAVRLCIENTAGWRPHERRMAQTLLQMGFGLTLDVGHAHTAAGQDDDFYQAHPEQLAHMHLHDATARACHLALGDGELDMPALAALAQRAHCRVVLEVKDGEALARSVKGWQRVCEETDSLA